MLLRDVNSAHVFLPNWSSFALVTVRVAFTQTQIHRNQMTPMQTDTNDQSFCQMPEWVKGFVKRSDVLLCCLSSSFTAVPPRAAAVSTWSTLQRRDGLTGIIPILILSTHLHFNVQDHQVWWNPNLLGSSCRCCAFKWCGLRDTLFWGHFH